MEGLVLPDYNNSICNIINDLLSIFNIENGGKKLGIDIKYGKKTSFVFLDGLGWNLYSKLKTNFNSLKISSVFPSSTDTATVSIVSGLTPGMHGVVGYKAFIKKAGAIVKPLENTYASSFHSVNLLNSGRMKDMFNINTIFNTLSKKKIKNLVITPNFTANSSFSSLIFSGSTYVEGYDNIWDAFHMYRKAMDNNNIKFVYLYIPYIDTIEHMYGYDSIEAYEAADYIINKIWEINKNLKTNTVISADHGHKVVDELIDFSGDKKLIRKLEIPPYGDSRAPLFRSRYDIKYELNKYKMKIFDKTERELLLGKIGKNVEDILPDYIGAAIGSTGFTFNYKLKNGNKKERYGEPISNHGGLSPDEMEVPILTL